MAHEHNGVTQTPTDFFQSIGSQVAGLDKDVQGTEEDDVPPVEEIESLCMNCHDNVRNFHPKPWLAVHQLTL